MFLDSLKYFSVTPKALAEVDALIELFWAEASDGDETFRTILCGWDDGEQTRKRAMRLGVTAKETPLTNGTLGFVGLPSNAVFEAWQNGGIPGVVELTESEFIALLPQGDL